MTASIDITGQRFGKLVALRRDGTHPRTGGAMWLFDCDCGKQHRTAYINVRSAGVHCCGCLTGGTTHGMKNHPLYVVWRSMRARCGHITKGTPNYAGRGITVCDEWQDMGQFGAWALSNGYRRGLQLDRIDNDGNYEPENCRFVTQRVNLNNKRTTPKFSFFGEPLTCTEASRKFGIPPHTIRRRIRVMGMTPDDAATKPLR